MGAIINIENIDLVGRGHEEDMNDCLLTYKLDPGNLRLLGSSPSLKCTSAHCSHSGSCEII